MISKNHFLRLKKKITFFHMEISSLFKKSRFFFFWKYQNASNFWYKKLIFQYQEFKLFDFKNSLFDIRKCLKNVSASYKIYKRIAKGRLVFKFFEEIMYDLSKTDKPKKRKWCWTCCLSFFASLAFFLSLSQVSGKSIMTG